MRYRNSKHFWDGVPLVKGYLARKWFYEVSHQFQRCFNEDEIFFKQKHSKIFQCCIIKTRKSQGITFLEYRLFSRDLQKNAWAWKVYQFKENPWSTGIILSKNTHLKKSTKNEFVLSVPKWLQIHISFWLIEFCRNEVKMTANSNWQNSYNLYDIKPKTDWNVT